MEAIRELLNETEIKTFKVKIFGFDKKEVADYINTVEENFKKSNESYQKNSLEQNNSLAMALREKESLLAKMKELEEKIEFLTPESDETRSKLIAENHALKAKLEVIPQLQEENAKLQNEMIEIKTKWEYTQNEHQNLIDLLTEKEEIILEQCKNTQNLEQEYKMELAKVKSEYEAKRELQLCQLKTAKDSLLKLSGVLENL